MGRGRVDILIYLLDSNVITDMMKRVNPVSSRARDATLQGHLVCLCTPVHYEIVRGLIKVDARRRLEDYYTYIVPALRWKSVTRKDWDEAARLWAEMQKQGRQLSDIDLLLASIALRLDAILVSADEDFGALPVRRENWRHS